MNVERGKFDGKETPEERTYWDARFAAAAEKAWQDPAYRAIFADEEASDARADADIAAGRVYPHELVVEWFATFGNPDHKSFHDWLNGRG